MCCDILSDDHEAAQVSFDKLVSEFSDDRDGLGSAYYQIALTYEKKGQPDKAQNIYRLIDPQYPNGDDFDAAAGDWSIMKARLQIHSYIDSGNYPKALESCEMLIRDFRQDSYFPEALLGIAYRCRQKASVEQENNSNTASQCRLTAVNMWEKILSAISLTDELSPRFYYSAAQDCYVLGDHEKAMSYYSKTANYWPEGEYACSSLKMIPRIYEKLKESNKLSEAQADEKIAESYEQILESCSECKAAKTARRWLATHKANLN